MGCILEIIQKQLGNYSKEEFLKNLSLPLYATYVDHGMAIIEVYFAMQHIQGYHRHFLWSQFKHCYGMTPKEYFMIPFNKLRQLQEKYEAAIQ